MNPIIRNSITAGLVLAAVGAYADVIVDDFSGSNPGYNMLTNGGAWLADADTWPAIGGSSRVVSQSDPSQDLVKGNAFSGDNITSAYADDGGLASLIYVTKDVSETKKWAYGGWVLDLLKPSPADTTKHSYDLPSWQWRNEVDVSSCDAVQITLQFDADRLLWIDAYVPSIEKTNALAPQWGWRYTGTGQMETKTFKLGGVTGPQQKWTDATNKVAFDVHAISRLRFLYEGMKKGSATAAYDTVGHLFKIKKVAFTGANCQLKPNPGAAEPIIARKADARGASFAAVDGALRFSDLSAETQVTVRDLSGHVVAQGQVNGSRNALDVSALKNGVYMVQAVGAKLTRTGSFTVLK
jgi:hypothetical protein